MRTIPPVVRPSFVTPMLCGLVILATISMAYGCWTAARDSADLERRAQESTLFRNHDDPYVDPDATYPPSALPVFALLVLKWELPRRAIWLVYNLLALVAIFGLVRVWGRDWPRWASLAFILVITACKPTRAGIGLGQFHLIPLAAIVASEWAASRSEFRSGIFAGLALLKPTMSLPYLFVLLAKKRWPAIAGAVILQASLFLFTSLWLGIGPIRLIREWLDKARSQLAFGTIDVPSLIGRAFPSASGLTPIVTALILIVTGVMVFKWRDRSPFGLTAFTTFSAAVMTYHRHYDLVLLLPTFAFLMDAGIARGRKLAGWASCVLGAVLIIPSDGRLIGKTAERVYDLGFVVVVYLILAVLLVEIASEPGKEHASGPSLS